MLLSSTDERVRLLALDLVGLMCTEGKPVDQRAFALAGGFETVGKYLVRHWISLPVGHALLCLAVRAPSRATSSGHLAAERAQPGYQAASTPACAPATAPSRTDEWLSGATALRTPRDASVRSVRSVRSTRGSCSGDGLEPIQESPYVHCPRRLFRTRIATCYPCHQVEAP